MPEPLVWYVAYGSNLSSVRLQRYLDTCDDPSPPEDAVACPLSHRLFFAHESTTWSGGTAFVDPEPDDGAGTRSVAWLLRAEQFLHVLAAENALPPLGISVDDLPRSVGSTEVVADRRYGLVVAAPSPDRRPAFTFTTPEAPLPPSTLPHADYVDTIVGGLIEHHGLDLASALRYLAERGSSGEVGGVADTGEEIADGLEGGSVFEECPDVAAEPEIAADEGVERRT